MANDKWNLIIHLYSQKPRDVITTPAGNRKGKWFHVSVERDKVVISEAKEHHYSSKLKINRTLNPNEVEEVFDLYLKRKTGAVNSKEIQETTMNSSYWFGIFSDLEL